MKPVNVKSNTCIDSGKKVNNKDHKFTIGDIVRILEYKIFLQNITLKISLKKFMLLKKLKILCHGHMFLTILAEKKLLEIFTKKNFKKNKSKRI